MHVRLSGLRLRRPRQWGGCWLACHLWEHLSWMSSGRRDCPRHDRARAGWGTRWLNVLKTLVTYRLIDPGSEWRLHRQWYEQSAMGDLLGEDFDLVQKDNLYRCLDKLLAHKTELFSFLQQRWKTLFEAKFEALLCALTSTYFECDPPEAGKRRHGHSRDKRSDCVQVVIALIVTPDGLPLAHEVMPGNTSDKRRCATSCNGSKPSMARRNAPGSWTAAFRPRRCWPRCGRRRHQRITLSAPRVGDSAKWSGTS